MVKEQTTYKRYMRYILKSWVCWVCLVAIGVVWGLPRIPHYQDWMPYGYELGGMALVAMYLSFGLGSLGIYGLVAGGMRWGATVSQNRKAFRVGLTALVLAAGLVWCYTKLMVLTLKL